MTTTYRFKDNSVPHFITFAVSNANVYALVFRSGDQVLKED